MEKHANDQHSGLNSKLFYFLKFFFNLKMMTF